MKKNPPGPSVEAVLTVLVLVFGPGFGSVAAPLLVGGVEVLVCVVLGFGVVDVVPEVTGVEVVVGLVVVDVVLVVVEVVELVVVVVVVVVVVGVVDPVVCVTGVPDVWKFVTENTPYLFKSGKV